jgi:hypothetical protein
MSEVLLEITIPQFITHVLKKSIPKNSTKKTKSPYFKLGGNAFYSQGVYHFERAFIIRQMHLYLDKYIPKNVEINEKVRVSIDIYAPRNYGDISIAKNKEGVYNIRWKPYQSDYKADWDIDNLQFIWRKLILDHLRGKIENGSHLSRGILVDDSVDYVIGNSGDFIETPELEDRKIVIKLTKV